MNSHQKLALVEIKCSENGFTDYTSQTTSWVNDDLDITAFDFDNHSDGYTADLAIKLLDQTDCAYILLQDTRGADQLGSISKFLNTVTRKYRHKVMVVHIGVDSRTIPFFKVLKATHVSTPTEAKAVFDDWINGFRNDQHRPGKGIYL